MKKKLLYLLLAFTVFMNVLWLPKPLKELLIDYGMVELKAQLIAGIIVRLFIIFTFVLIISKLSLKKYNSVGKSENLHALLIPYAFILMGIVSNWNVYRNTDAIILILFTASVFVVGFAEELLFRGTILPVFIEVFKKNKYTLYLAVVASSSIFGVIHFMNIFREPENFWGITRQVFFGVSIGVFFGGLMLRTKSIVVPSLFHGFVNFSFGTGDLKEHINYVANDEVFAEAQKASTGINWGSVIPTTLLFIIILGSGLYMIKQVDKKAVLERVDAE